MTLMPTPMRLLYLVLSLMLFSGLAQVYGQSGVGIGSWRLHVPYTQGRAVADAGDKVYLAAEQGLFYYDKEFRNVQPLTRTDGLSEQGLSTIAYDPDTRTLIIAYANANVDLVQENRISNMAGILRRSAAGIKTIRHILVHQQMAYLSTDFGIVVLDLGRQEIKDMYVNLGASGETLPVLGTAIAGDSIYLASSAGIKVAHRLTSNLKDFRSWRPLSAGLPANAAITSIVTFQNKVYAATAAHGLFGLQQGTFTPVPIPENTLIRSLRASTDHLVAATSQGVLLLNRQLQPTVISHASLQQPQDAVAGKDNMLWVADGHHGLVAVGPGNQVEAFAPSGPASSNSFRVRAGNGSVYVLSGGYDQNFQPLNREDGYYGFQNSTWFNNSHMQAPHTSATLRDFVSAVYNPVTGHVYMPTYGQGLLVWKGEERPTLYNGTNSTLVSTEPATDRTEQVRLTDAAVDAQGNVWVVNRHGLSGAGLHVLRPDGEWQGYSIPGIADNGNLERLVVDDYGYKWISVSRGNVRNGLLVYDETRQQVKQLGAGSGNGNLPGGAVYGLAKDLNGDIWVGTASGLAVYYNAGSAFSSQHFDARIPILEGRPLLGGQVVRDIAVDGANRKWVATDNGLWLIGADGDRVLQHFTTQNSPLPSNKILSVAMEHRTGEVFVVTAAGIASYRAGATITEGKPDCAQVYPNPVRPDFTGLIGVSGLPNNAHVRITDISGTLVHKTKATGGTLTWDARGYNGKRVKAGVYLVMSSDDEGKQTCISKIAVLE